MQKLLIVEDNLAICYTLEFLLKSQEYDVVIANNLHDASIEMSFQIFDLVLLDRNLPDGLGDDLVYHIRKELKLNTPIIIGSTTMQHNNIHALMDLGANDYIIKPYEMENLVHRIDYWIQHNVAN